MVKCRSIDLRCEMNECKATKNYMFVKFNVIHLKFYKHIIFGSFALIHFATEIDASTFYHIYCLQKKVVCPKLEGVTFNPSLIGNQPVIYVSFFIACINGNILTRIINTLIRVPFRCNQELFPRQEFRAVALIIDSSFQESCTSKMV